MASTTVVTTVDRPREIGAFAFGGWLLDWHEIPGWLSDEEAALLASAAKQVAPGQCIVELGSYCGRSAAVLANAAVDGVCIYCIDKWEGAPEDSFRVGCARRNGWIEALALRGGHHIGMSALEFESNMKAAGLLFTRVFPIVSDSAEAAEHTTLPPVGLLYIDADHSQEAAARDFRAWQPHLAPGAAVFFHDYAGFPGVYRAVQELGLKVEVKRDLAKWTAPA